MHAVFSQNLTTMTLNKCLVYSFLPFGFGVASATKWHTNTVQFKTTFSQALVMINNITVPFWLNLNFKLTLGMRMTLNTMQRKIERFLHF